MKKKFTEREVYLKNQKRKKVITLVWQLAILVAFIGLWELSTALEWLDDFIVSSPSRIVQTFEQLLKDDFMKHVGTTVLECVIGFTLATVLGSLIAIGLWWSESVRKVLMPYIVVLNSLPKIALGPIIIIWAGAGMGAIITMTVLICIIVTIISVFNGFEGIDEGKTVLLRSMGANKFQILTKLILPGSVPNFLSVLKINVGLSWVGVIMGEYLVSSAGLGYLIIYGGQIFKLDLVMTSTVVLCVLAAIMYLVVALIERSCKKF